jgi:Tol biopolymer transport system component
MHLHRALLRRWEHKTKNMNYKIAFFAIVIIAAIALVTGIGLVYQAKQTKTSAGPALSSNANKEISGLIKEEGTPSLETNKQNKPSMEKSKIVYTQTNDDETTIWITSPPDLADKSILTQVKHASGYPIKASISPDGTKIAYTLLPFASTQPSTNGKLFLFDIKEKKQKELDNNIDYYVVPRWSSDSSNIAYIKTITISQEKYRTELYSTDIKGLKNLLLSDEKSLGINPIGYSPDSKQFYYDRIAPNGDELWAINILSNSNRFITTISIGSSWNLSLSPDGKEILGSIIESREPVSYAVVSISVDGKNIYTWANGAKMHYTPIWGPSVKEITYNIPYYENPANSSNYKYGGELVKLKLTNKEKVSLSQSSEWMDVPIAWSPDRNWLLIERYHSNSGMELMVRDYQGEIYQTKLPLDKGNFIGWTTISF